MGEVSPNLLMSGHPGSGKDLLARTLPSILQRLSVDEALEVTKLYSVSGMLASGAAAKLDAVLRDRDRGLPVGLDERQTLATDLDGWLDSATPTVRPPTWKRYAELLRQYAAPALGHTPLARLTAQQVQGPYARKLAQGLSGTTVHHLHAVLHRALGQAVRLGQVARNVTELVDAPGMADRDLRVLDGEQERGMSAAVKGDRLEALYVLAISTGMRQGELSALRWRDITLDRCIVQVCATLQRTRETGYTLAPPKAKRSRRQSTLTTLAREALRAHRCRRAGEHLAAGAWDGTVGVVSPTRSADRPMPPTSCITISIRCWSALGRRASASTICATRRPSCCWGAAPTPRS
jgi:integrase